MRRVVGAFTEPKGAQTGCSTGTRVCFNSETCGGLRAVPSVADDMYDAESDEQAKTHPR